MTRESIDFIPDEFHTRNRRRCRTFAQHVGLFVLLVLMATMTWKQRDARESLNSVRERLRHDLAGFGGHEESIEQLTAQFDDLRVRAELADVLEHPIAPSRLISTISDSRPPYVHLSRFHFFPESRRAPHVSNDPTSVAEGDLRAVRQVYERHTFVISIAGVAPTATHVSSYINNLRATGLFAAVQLVITEERMVFGHLRRRFEIRLQVRELGIAPPQAKEPA